VAVDAGQAPLFVGGEDDAGVTGVGVQPPGDAALAIELVAAGAGEDHVVRRVGRNAVVGGNAVSRSGRRDGRLRGLGGDGGGRGGRLHGVFSLIAQVVQLAFVDDDLVVRVGVAEELHGADAGVARGDPAHVDDIGQPDDGQDCDEREKTSCHRLQTFGAWSSFMNSR
jgi:hypothetical protein